ncbi:MAG TPA: heme exporter protein CcmD [Methylovirgula sp.]|nr:heme exporter protein CcmD [Methylovirgula sp.]
MMRDPNFGFVLAAYCVAAFVVIGMIAGTLLDYAALKKSLARLSARTGRAVDDGQK